MKFAYGTGDRPLDGYTIKRGVGRGGFGEVYFAVSDAGKEVALKRICRHLEAEMRGETQCLNLKHPNLVALYDIRFDDHGEAWVVMEYIAGECLKDVLDRNPHGLPLEEALRWLRGLAAGVTYLHERGIIHRDLKPANVFQDEGVIKLGDYGLAKFVTASKRAGQTESVGTVHYMAPEIGRGIYDQRTDLYAMGCILYELAVGRPPFEGETSGEVLLKHLSATPELDMLAPPIRRVVERALLKDPSRRHASVAEFLADLEAGVRQSALQETSFHPSGPGGQAAARAAGAPAAALGTDEAPIDLHYIGDDEKEIQLGPVTQQAPRGAPPPRRGAVPPPVVAPPFAIPAAVAAGAYRPAPQLPAARPPAARQEEPIAKAFQDAWGGIVDWWNNGQTGAPVKVLVFVALALAVAFNVQWLIPLAIVAGLLYVVYYGIRSLILVGAAPPAGAAVRPPGHGPPPAGRPAGRPHAAVAGGRGAPDAKPLNLKLAELTGSWLVAAGASAALSPLMVVAGGVPLDTSVETWSLLAWLASLTAAAAWIVLTFSKFFCEPRPTERVRPRLALLGLGLGLGAAAYVGLTLLHVSLHDHLWTLRLLERSSLPASFYAADGAPLLPAAMAYFGGLLALPRWWKLSDPYRATRFSLWSTLACVLWAWGLDLFLNFPQPWCLMLAGAIAVAVQVSAPWLHPRERAALRRTAAEA